MSEKVYQFKVSLIGITPMIWRTIQVPENYTFEEFHIAIQDAMGWEDYHLHEFHFGEIHDDEFNEIKYSGQSKIKDYFAGGIKTLGYAYDFGDDWQHKITFQKTLPAKEKTQYPLCVDGKRACPPEDCGGVYGYKHLLQVMKSRRSFEYEEMMEWLGEHFYPEKFKIKDIEFRNIPCEELS
jgi:hypothetical protein